jgi:hypothetical protein
MQTGFKMMKMKIIKRIFLCCLSATLLILAGCSKDKYFEDSGKVNGTFQGNVLEYLKSKPQFFDSVTKVIRLAGMENIFATEPITFFAPGDSSIRSTIAELNRQLSLQGKQTVYRLEQIKPEVWRAQLARYLFKGKKTMNDFPQLDPSNVAAYPGQIYASYDGAIMNAGVVYNDAGGVKYAGYRQLTLAYIPSPSAPRDYLSWYSSTVASVNIAPTNGYVHALRYSNHYFGFEVNQFIESAIAKGIGP